jgi:hypothetical protein
MREEMRLAAAAGVVALSLISAGCGGGSADSGETGRLTLLVTDSPITEASKVVVEFTGVELKRAGAGDTLEFDFEPRQIDLLALSGGGSEILIEDEPVPAGDYEWIRLKVNAGRNASDSFIELTDGSQHALFIPSGHQSGLKLIRGFTVGAGQVTDFTIDFELRKSVIHPPGLGDPYLLKPVLRLVNNLEVGVIEGTVAASIAAGNCSPAVYAWTGADVTPDDLGSANPPLVTSGVALDEATGEFRYRIAFVPTGSYTVALTCQADDDDAETDDTIAFVDSSNTTVTAGNVSTVNFAGG